MENLKSRIGKKIQMRRSQLGFTQVTLAKAIGVDQARISKWETGEVSPDPANKTALIRALKIDESFFEIAEEQSRSQVIGEIVTSLPALNDDELALVLEMIKSLPNLDKIEASIVRTPQKVLKTRQSK